MKTCEIPTEDFIWGIVDKWHLVGLYAIAEYRYKGGIFFHPYIDGKDTCRGYESLDASLAGAIALRHDGPSTKADAYFIRAIGGVNG